MRRWTYSSHVSGDPCCCRSCRATRLLRTCSRGIVTARVSAWRILVVGERLEQSLKTYTYSLWACETADCVLHRADKTRESGWGERISGVLQSMIRGDDTVGIRRRKTFYPGYADCPMCRRATCRSESTTIRHATTSSTGLRLRVRNCLNCGFEDEHIQVVPKKIEYDDESSRSSRGGGGSSSRGGGSSSSGSGGGGSSGFGGGSSGSGGMGSSW